MKEHVFQYPKVREIPVKKEPLDKDTFIQGIDKDQNNILELDKTLEHNRLNMILSPNIKKSRSKLK